MKPSADTLALQVMALLLSLLLTRSGQADNNVMTQTNSDNPLPYARTPEMTGYRLEAAS